MSMFRKLWQDENGFIISSELVLIGTILVIGMTVGLTSVRNAVVTELADVADAIGLIDQSYSYGTMRGHHAFTDGSAFNDRPDFCDQNDPGAPFGNSRCITICQETPNGEGTGQTNP